MGAIFVLQIQVGNEKKKNLWQLSKLIVQFLNGKPLSSSRREVID